MDNEYAQAVKALNVILNRHMVTCPACGCRVPADTLCSQCNAPLDMETLQTANKKSSDVLQFPLSKSPQFKQDMWLDFYVNMFRIGETFGEVFNGKKVNRAPEELARQIAAIFIIEDLSDYGIESREAVDYHWEYIDDFLKRVRSLTGYSSLSCKSTSKLDVILAGFVTTSDGTSCRARSGETLEPLLRSLQWILLPLQEMYVLLNCADENLFTEQYTRAFDETFLPSWCDSNRHGLFAGRHLADWDAGIDAFKTIRDDPKYRKKYFKWYRDIVQYNVPDEEFIKFGSDTAQGVANMYTYLKYHCISEMCDLLAIQIPMNVEIDNYADEWLHNTVGITTLIAHK